MLLKRLGFVSCGDFDVSVLIMAVLCLGVRCWLYIFGAAVGQCEEVPLGGC